MIGTDSETAPTPAWHLAAVVASALLGLGLIAEQSYRLSATFDEVTYLQVGSRWWRGGDQESISRMGSPLTSWKVQQAPTFWALDRFGLGAWVDDPIEHQAELLPIVRLGGCWTWLATLLIAATWARKLYGPRAMAMAAAVFAIEPNLLAHGTLSTMELPVTACASGMFLGFWSFLRSGSRRAFWATAALGGLAMSCKFTTVLIPPILAIVWAVDLALRREPPLRIARVVGLGMLGFALAMVASNSVVTGFATIPLSDHTGPHPSIEGRFPGILAGPVSWAFRHAFPQDWVGFANQVIMQRDGAPSYLFGERRMTGWWYYYPVALAVKLPLALWFLFAARAGASARGVVRGSGRGWVLPAVVLIFLLSAVVGSKRNFGVRYLLPVAVPAIVWASGLAEGTRRSRALAAVGVLGMAASVAMIHPHELVYFNELAGGPIGGRKVLADSNLDWGQGAKSLARLQRERPELRDLTIYYFGETDPAHYGVEGRSILFVADQTPAGLPAELSPGTEYLAVSASLQWGPWGPEGYFRRLNSINPVCYTDDTTIAIYRASDLARPAVRTGRGPG